MVALNGVSDACTAMEVQRTVATSYLTVQFICEYLSACDVIQPFRLLRPILPI